MAAEIVDLVSSARKQSCDLVGQFTRIESEVQHQDAGPVWTGPNISKLLMQLFGIACLRTGGCNQGLHLGRVLFRTQVMAQCPASPLVEQFLDRLTLDALDNEDWRDFWIVRLVL